MVCGHFAWRKSRMIKWLEFWSACKVLNGKVKLCCSIQINPAIIIPSNSLLIFHAFNVGHLSGSNKRRMIEIFNNCNINIHDEVFLLRWKLLVSFWKCALTLTHHVKIDVSCRDARRNWCNLIFNVWAGTSNRLQICSFTYKFTHSTCCCFNVRFGLVHSSVAQSLT